MTVRFMLGLGLAVLLFLTIAIGVAYGTSYAKKHSLHRKRRWRRRGKKLRIDDLLVTPKEAEPGES